MHPTTGFCDEMHCTLGADQWQGQGCQASKSNPDSKAQQGPGRADRGHAEPLGILKLPRHSFQSKENGNVDS